MHAGVVRRAATVLGLTLTGDALIYVVLPLHAADFGLTFAWVGVLLAANRLIRIFTYGTVARLGRRIGARGLMIAGAVGGTLSTLAYAIFSGGEPLLAARVAWGLSYAALNLATLAYALHEPVTAARNVGAARSISALGQVFALSVGAWLVAYTGPREVFFVLAAVTALALPLALRLPVLPEAPQAKPQGSLPWPSTLDVWSFALGFAVDGIFIITLSILLAGSVSATNAVLAGGLLLAMRRGVEVVVGPIGGYIGERFGAERMNVLFGLGIIAGLALVAVGAVVAGAIAILLTQGVINVLGPVIVAARAPDDPMGRLSVFVTWRDIGAALGPLVAGFALAGLGPTLMYALLTALVAIVLAADLLARRS